MVDFKARLAQMKNNGGGASKPAPTQAARGTGRPPVTLTRSPFRGIGDAKVTERLPKLGEGAQFSDHKLMVMRVKFHEGEEKEYFIVESGILESTLHDQGDERGWSCPIRKESMGNIKGFLLACAERWPDELATDLVTAEEMPTGDQKTAALEAAWTAIATWACGEENPLEGIELKCNSTLRTSKPKQAGQPGNNYIVHTFKSAA